MNDDPQRARRPHVGRRDVLKATAGISASLAAGTVASGRGRAADGATGDDIRMPDSFRHHEAKLDDIRLHYVREGSGPPLVLVHGWPGFWWEWHRNIGPLAQHFDVIAFDMRGYGQSEKPDPDNLEAYHIDRVVNDIARLLDHLDIQRAYLVGHDWASMIAHKFIRKYRSRLKKAAIINPFLPDAETRYLGDKHFSESWYFMFHQIQLSVDMVRSSREATRTYFQHFLSHWSHDPDLFTPKEVEIYTDTMRRPGNVRGGFNFYRAAATFGIWNQADRTVSDFPVTFLHGRGDPVVPPAWSDLCTKWYTNFDLTYVGRAGHFVMRERPEVVNRHLIKAFGE